jgi:hypothetical protein
MGGAFGSGFAQGFNQSMQQAQDRAIQNEYKKVLMSKAKNDIEMHMLDQQDMQAASQGDQNALMRLLIRKDPMMAFAMSGQQGGQPQQPEVNIGMNYEEPAAPQTQVTFPAQLTGVPQMGSFDKERFMAHKLYGQTTNPADITGSDILLHPELQIPVRVPRDRRGYRWDLAQAVPPNIVRETEAGGPTGSQKSAYSGTTGRKIEAIPPIPQPVEIVRETVTNPDGSQSIIEVPKYPVQGQPQPQNRTKPTLGPKPGQPIQFDNKETLDEYVKTFGGGNRGIQKTPPESQVPIKNDDLPYWVNSDTLTSPWDVDTPKNLSSKGFKRITPEQRKIIDGRNNLYGTLSNMKKEMAAIWGAEGQSTGLGEFVDRTIGSVGRKTSSLLQTSPNTAVWDAHLYPRAVESVRAFGEVGNISAPELKGAESSIPKLTDNKQTAYKKMNELENWVDTKTKGILFGKQTQSDNKGVQETKTINGKTYFKINNKWYEK